MTFQSIKTLILTLAFALSVTACQNKPSVDKSVEYKNARSIPSLDPSLKKENSGDKAVK